MSSADSGTPLWKTDTDWALIYLAQADIPEVSRDAWRRLFTRYERPVWRSLRKLVNDENIAHELYQEFWLRFLRGDFANARPERGRFRNLLQTVLTHLVADYYRARRPTTPIDDSDWVESDDTVLARLADDHNSYWRGQLIHRTLIALIRDDDENQTSTRILGLEIEHPDLSSVEKGERLGQELNRPISAENYRQLLHRTRRRFALLLIEEVRNSLAEPTGELVREELAELDLLKHCRFAFE